MTKKETLRDVTRLINGSSSVDQASDLVRKYFNTVCDLHDLAEFVRANDHVPDGRMAASGDDDEAGSGDDFEFGGGQFGGGGGSGKW